MVAGFIVYKHRMLLAASKAVVLAPLPQGHNDRKQVQSLLGEDVFLVGATVRGRRRVQHTERDQSPEASAKDALRQTQRLLKLAKSANAIEGVPDDQQGPPISRCIECPGNRANRTVQAGSLQFRLRPRRAKWSSSRTKVVRK